MEIYTIATSDDYDVKANNNIYLKKVSYTFEESNRLLEVAKKYYYTYLVESESTDFNDRYSSSNTYYEQINKSNMIVKDNEFYGVIVYGLEKHQKEFDEKFGNIYGNSNSADYKKDLRGYLKANKKWIDEEIQSQLDSIEHLNSNQADLIENIAELNSQIKNPEIYKRYVISEYSRYKKISSFYKKK